MFLLFRFSLAFCVVADALLEMGLDFFTPQEREEIVVLAQDKHSQSFQYYQENVGRYEALETLLGLIDDHTHELTNFAWLALVKPQIQAWLQAVRGNSSDILAAFDDEACLWLPTVLDELFAMAISTDDPNEISFAHEAYSAASMALSFSSCCQKLVAREFSGRLTGLLTQDGPWELQGTRPDLFWACSEWPFWGPQRGICGSGLRGMLWETVLANKAYQLYNVFEPLTVQYVFMPLCILETYTQAIEGAFYRDKFFDPYGACAPTQLAYAIDHLIVAGGEVRAHQVFDRASSFRVPGKGSLLKWTSIHATSIYFMSGTAQWPWWQLHPSISPYIEFLENNVELLASERENSTQAAQYKSDFFPMTSRGLVWRGVDFWLGGQGHDVEACQFSPNTCDKLKALGWQPSDDIVTRKQSWSIVAPGSSMGGHSGQHQRINIQICIHGCEDSELHLNGEVVPYRRGKAIAWQDGWRHEVLNHGVEERWVFMITVPHPEFEDAWIRSRGHWPSVHKIVTRSSPTVPFDPRWKAQSPWDRASKHIVS